MFDNVKEFVVARNPSRDTVEFFHKFETEKAMIAYFPEGNTYILCLKNIKQPLDDVALIAVLGSFLRGINNGWSKILTKDQAEQFKAFCTPCFIGDTPPAMGCTPSYS